MEKSKNIFGLIPVWRYLLHVRRFNEKSRRVKFVVVTMPPLWFLRYAYFIQSVNDSRVQTREASANLDSYVSECWDLKDRNQVNLMKYEFESMNQTVPMIEINENECQRIKRSNMSDYCGYGICLMKEMPDEMLEQMVVLSTICFRW